MAFFCTRRKLTFAVSATALAWPIAARAQQPSKIYRVGLLSGVGAVAATDERRKSLLTVLAASGIVEGQNLVFIQRFADGHVERLGGLAAELKAANVDVIVTLGY